LTFFAVVFFEGAFLAGMRRLLKLAVPVRLRPSSRERRKHAPRSSGARNGRYSVRNCPAA
jgi:hypothetical protein